MSSVWGRISTPQVTPYIVSKNAVRAFSERHLGQRRRRAGAGQRPAQPGPYASYGGWHSRRQGTLRRAFLAAAGAVRGFFKKNS